MSIRDANPEPAYLGDSVYVRPTDDTGYSLTLYLDNGTGQHTQIHIDPEVWKAMQAYVERYFPHWKES